MTQQFQIPAPDAPSEEWGRLAVSIPGWRWLPGMQTGPRREDGEPDGEICLDPWRIGNNDVPGPYADDPAWEAWPDPDDPATEGCLLRLVGLAADDITVGERKGDGTCEWLWWDGVSWRILTLGRACIAAAAAIGEWPGGEKGSRR